MCFNCFVTYAVKLAEMWVLEASFRNGIMIIQVAHSQKTTKPTNWPVTSWGPWEYLLYIVDDKLPQLYMHSRSYYSTSIMECNKAFERCSILNGILSDFPAVSYVKDLVHHPIDSQPCIQMVTVWPSIQFLSYKWFVSPLTNHLPSAVISFDSVWPSINLERYLKFEPSPGFNISAATKALIICC